MSLFTAIIDELLKGTKLMTTVADIEQGLTDTKTILTSIFTELDTVLAFIASLKASGSGVATQADLDQIGTMLTDVKTQAQADLDKTKTAES